MRPVPLEHPTAIAAGELLADVVILRSLMLSLEAWRERWRGDRAVWAHGLVVTADAPVYEDVVSLLRRAKHLDTIVQRPDKPLVYLEGHRPSTSPAGVSNLVTALEPGIVAALHELYTGNGDWLAFTSEWKGPRSGGIAEYALVGMPVLLITKDGVSGGTV